MGIDEVEQLLRVLVTRLDVASDRREEANLTVTLHTGPDGGYAWTHWNPGCRNGRGRRYLGRRRGRGSMGRSRG